MRPAIHRQPRSATAIPRLPRIVAFAVLVVCLGWHGGLSASASAQLIECVDQPLLGTFDANDDGILSVAEIREAGPDDAELQQFADELEADGVVGVLYGGCEGLEGGGDGGQDTATEPNATSVPGDASGDAQEADDADDDDEQLVVTVLPGVGHGMPRQPPVHELALMLGVASIASAVAMLVTRRRPA